MGAIRALFFDAGIIGMYGEVRSAVGWKTEKKGSVE